MTDYSKWIIDFKEDLNRELTVETVDPDVQRQISEAVRAAVISTLEAHQLLKPSETRDIEEASFAQDPIKQA